MADCDIVIAHRGPELGLWATVASCEMAAANSSLKMKYHIVLNGQDDVDEPLRMMVERLDNQDKLGSLIHSVEPLAPPTARNRGAASGTAPLIFFFDNHCLVEQNYFSQATHTMHRQPEIDSLHSVTKYWSGEPARYHYRFTLERNFWGYQVDERHFLDAPYRIAGGGHGGFLIRRSVWDEIGGYWDGFSGYGGEECYLELKLAMLDKSNFLDPNLVHWHHPGFRDYERDKSDDFLKNMLMCANIIGGDRWLERVANGLKIIEHHRALRNEPARDVEAFMLQARAKSHEHRKWFESVRKRTLNEQLVRFTRIGAAQ